MDLSPNDIRNYEFPNQMRGYEKEEVDNFLEQVAVALEEARQQNLKLTMEVDSVKTQLAGLKEFEDTIKNAAIDARRNADTTVATAKKEAAEILDSIKKEAEGLRESHSTEIAETEEKMVKLEQVKKSYISELRTLINSHLDMVDEIASAEIKRDLHGEEDGKSDTGGIEVTESSDVTRQQLETLASTPSEEVIKTEEANAPEEPVMEAQEEQAEAEAEPEDKPVDPELVAALKQYQTTGEESPPELNPEDFGPAPPQGTIVETDKSAEDIPSGFIAKVSEAELKAAREGSPVENGDDTNGGNAEELDPDGLSPDAQDRPTEHNVIDMDRPTKEDKAKTQVSSGELAEALDSVVNKFEEEMDKAEKAD